MKTMTVVINGFKKIIQRKSLLVLCAAVLLGTSAHAQREGEEPEDEAPVQSTSTGNAGPWGNSAGSTIGTPTTTPNTGGTAANPALGPGGGTLGRPAAGPTPDATGGPGGNPDVPFDTNMNLAFLAGGIVFAYVVYRRRHRLKPVVAEKK